MRFRAYASQCFCHNFETKVIIVELSHEESTRVYTPIMLLWGRERRACCKQIQRRDHSIGPLKIVSAPPPQKNATRATSKDAEKKSDVDLQKLFVEAAAKEKGKICILRYDWKVILLFLQSPLLLLLPAIA